MKIIIYDSLLPSSDRLFLHWVTFSEDRERLIRQYGSFRHSFLHRDTLPHSGGVATPRRNYDLYESQTSRVSKDRGAYAARNYKGKVAPKKLHLFIYDS